jgi:hypothetical protein
MVAHRVDGKRHRQFSLSPKHKFTVYCPQQIAKANPRYQDAERSQR